MDIRNDLFGWLHPVLLEGAKSDARRRIVSACRWNDVGAHLDVTHEKVRRLPKRWEKGAKTASKRQRRRCRQREFLGA